jgi:hypothetical protein
MTSRLSVCSLHPVSSTFNTRPRGIASSSCSNCSHHWVAVLESTSTRSVSVDVPITVFSDSIPLIRCLSVSVEIAIESRCSSRSSSSA